MSTVVYVDGFNLYYGLAKPLDCKWVDVLDAVRRQFPRADVRRMLFFEALVDGPSRANQLAYLAALDSLPEVQLILGRMKRKSRRCHVQTCQHPGDRTWPDYEEKHTDVSIAIAMVDDAHRGQCDRMVLVTADTDLLPAARMAKTIRPSLHVTLCVPALDRSRIRGSEELAKACDRATLLDAEALVRAQMPPSFTDGSGQTHGIPKAWRIAPANTVNAWKQANAGRLLPHRLSWLS